MAVPADDADTFLAPAACYHVYASLAGQCLRQPQKLTIVTTCARQEIRSIEDVARLTRFRMREVVMVGEAAWVAAERDEWMSRIAAFADAIGLAVACEAATDTYFRGRRARPPADSTAEGAEIRASRRGRSRGPHRRRVLQPARGFFREALRHDVAGRASRLVRLHRVRDRAMDARLLGAVRTGADCGARVRRCPTIYDEYLTQSEMQRWILETDVSWSRIDVSLALTQPDLLDQIRESALIESYFPIYTTRLMRAIWDDIEATSVFSIQLYESYKHFYVLNRYLAVVNYRPIQEAELIEIRRRTLALPIEDAAGELTRYMLSEHFAAYFFLRLSRQAREPVLMEITGHIAKDEFRHTQFAYDLLDARLKAESGMPGADSPRRQPLSSCRRRRRRDRAGVREERSAGNPDAEPAHAAVVWCEPGGVCPGRTGCP